MRVRNAIRRVSVLLSAAVLLSAGCMNGSFVTDPDGERDAFVDAYATWKSGLTTFDEMKASYGEPADRVDYPERFAVRWIRRQRIAVSASEPLNAVNPVSRFERHLERPRRYITAVNSLEAFFDARGVLTTFRIQTNEKK